MLIEKVSKIEIRKGTTKMTLGGSIFLLVLGAILAFAVGEGQIGTLDLDMVGYILLGAGLLGLLLTVVMRGDRGRGRTVVREERDEII